MHALVQVAGIHDAREAQLLIDRGVDEIGIPLELAVHTPDITIAEAAMVCRAIGSPDRYVLITYLETADDLLSLSNELGVSKIQIHGDITLRELARLRKLRPELVLTKSLIVNGSDDLIEIARSFDGHVDRFITDTFDPVSGASGATGKTHDWATSRLVVEAVQTPVLLAGGLHPKNVTDAIYAVRPAGVDSHTGVEGPDGRKSDSLVRDFVRNARAAFAHRA